MLEVLKSAGETYMPRAFAIATRLVDWRAARDPASELNLLPLLVAEGDLACDVGANHGLFSFWLLRLGARVVAFEPNPHMIRILRHRFPRAIRDGDLRLFDCALSDSEGEAVLHVPRGYSPLATIDGRLIAAGQAMDEVKVAIRRLDACVNGDAAFLKIDVEGHEQKVLEGASGLLRASRPTILVEAEERHRPGAVAAMRLLLEPFGYEGFFCAQGRMHALGSFDPDHHQRRDALNVEGTRVRKGQSYVNNFIFVARPAVKERLAGWAPQRLLYAY